ncbi:MAG: hypothetical protein JW830_13660 [Bacteroidales bacterium]|nr:hypothetical protein [Bacteroidales bacterium]
MNTGLRPVLLRSGLTGLESSIIFMYTKLRPVLLRSGLTGLDSSAALYPKGQGPET